MKLEIAAAPRRFEVDGVRLSDWGAVRLEPDEMLTLRSPGGRDCDITAKRWGYYLGPSLNGRLRGQGYRTALVANADDKLFVMVVDQARIEEFQRYLEAGGGHRILRWLDEWFEGGQS